MRERNPDILRCAWCDARQRNRTQLNEHEAEHRRAEIALAEAGRTLKDSRAMMEWFHEAAATGLDVSDPGTMQ